MANTKRKKGGRVNDSWTVKELRAEGKRRKIKGLRPDQRKDELIDMLNDAETNYTAFQGKGEAVGTRAENEEEKRRRAEEARKAREDELAAVLEEPGRIVDPSLTDVERQRQGRACRGSGQEVIGDHAEPAQGVAVYGDPGFAVYGDPGFRNPRSDGNRMKYTMGSDLEKVRESAKSGRTGTSASSSLTS